MTIQRLDLGLIHGGYGGTGFQGHELQGTPKGLGVAAYAANAVHFDGTNDYLTRGAGLTGAADSKLFTFSFWVKVDRDDLTFRWFHGSTSLGGSANAGVLFSKDNTNDNLVVIGLNAAGSTILRVETSADSIDAVDGWVHLMGSFDMADTGKRHLYVNDVSDLASVVTYTNDTIDFTVADWSVGARTDAAVKHEGDMADFWFEDGVYVDLSVEANRRLFIDAGGKPVDLGSDGSTPTGTSPLIFLSGTTADWHTNKGTGGGFTENGALTDAASSPSD